MKRLERVEEVLKELQLFPITTNILLQYSANKADVDYILADRGKTVDLFVYFSLFDDDTSDEDEYNFVRELKEKFERASFDGLIGEFDSVDNPFGNILAFRRFKR